MTGATQTFDATSVAPGVCGLATMQVHNYLVPTVVEQTNRG